MEPGIYAGISNEAYHAGAGVSQSQLSVLARSPLHYWAKYMDPNREPEPPRPAFVLGTAIHTAVLEPGEFFKRYVVAPVVDRRTKEGKAAWAEAEAAAEAKGAAVIGNDDALVAMRIAEQVRQHPTAKKLFGLGQAEMSVYWRDEETGLLCRCRPDWMALPLIVDLKSTEDASAAGFARSAWDYRYWVQAAWYMDGIEAAMGLRPDAFIFAAFEKKAPHACGFYYADDAMLDMGRKEYRKQLRVLADCISSDTWPGYPTDVLPLGVPAWALKAANDNQQGAA